jgi:glutamyl-tRNA reductase
VPKSTYLVANVIHQREAALDARERLLSTVANAGDALVLGTCHRVEVYEVADEPRQVAGMRTLVDEAAAAHLFRVAAGLDSAIAGEPQILRQLRAAYVSSARRLPPMLRGACERALHVGRDLRRSTRLGEVRRSVGSLAVDEALRLVPDPASATVLVVGAGEMGKLAVRALALRVGRVIVANRDVSRARELASENGAEALALEAVPEALGRCAAVISAADTRGTLFTRERLAPLGRLVIVDIAVPRSVPEDARDLPGLVYRSVDDLSDGDVALPDADVAAAGVRCDREAASFMGEWRERAAAGAIRDLRASAETLRRAQLERALRRLGHLGERDRQVVEALSVGLVNALLHAPSVSLREEPSRGDMARDLFRLRR